MADNNGQQKPGGAVTARVESPGGERPGESIPTPRDGSSGRGRAKRALKYVSLVVLPLAVLLFLIAGVCDWVTSLQAPRTFSFAPAPSPASETSASITIEILEVRPTAGTLKAAVDLWLPVAIAKNLSGKDGPVYACQAGEAPRRSSDPLCTRNQYYAGVQLLDVQFTPRGSTAGQARSQVPDAMLRLPRTLPSNGLESTSELEIPVSVLESAYPNDSYRFAAALAFVPLSDIQGIQWNQVSHSIKLRDPHYVCGQDRCGAADADPSVFVNLSRTPMHAAVLYIEAAIPLAFALLFFDILFLNLVGIGQNLTELREVLIGMTATMLAILPLRDALVPSSMSGLTRIDGELGLGLLLLIALALGRYWWSLVNPNSAPRSASAMSLDGAYTRQSR